MPLYLRTMHLPVVAIGICDRCRKKFPLGELLPDPNTPGLRVCDKDRDQYDPWRLPARQPEDISLPFARPDVPIALDPPPQPVIEVIATESDEGLLTEESPSFGGPTPIATEDNP